MVRHKFAKNKVVVFWITVAVILLIFVAILLKFTFDNNYLQAKTFYEVWSLQNEYKDISLKNLDIDGRKYTVSAGKVVGDVSLDTKLKILNFVAFYQWSKEDPLFYSPDIDVVNFKKSIERINQAQSYILSVFNRTDHVYPIDFLESFALVAQKTNDFLKTPSFENAENLILEQKKAAYLYGKEASNLSRLVAGNNSRDLGIVDFDVRKSIKTTVSDLEKASSNSKILITQIQEREDCLQGKNACFRPVNKFEKPKVNSLEQVNVGVNFLDKKLIFSPLSEGFDYSSVKGPYIARTPCFGWGDNFTSPQHYFYSKDDSDVANVQLATDIYFRQLVGNTISWWEQLLISRGIQYMSIPTSTLYYCTDGEYLAQISELDLFLKQNKPLLASNISFNSSETQQAFNSAKEFEIKFFNSKYPNYDDLENLATYYGYLYKLMTNTEAPSKYSSLEEELLRREVIISRKLGNFYKVLNYSANVIKDSDILKQSDPVKEKATVETLLYPVRNFYGLMYMPFSPSVFRNIQEFAYLDHIYVKGGVELDGSFMTYTQSIKKYSQKQIYNWFRLKTLK